MEPQLGIGIMGKIKNIKSGDKVLVKEEVLFCDGTKHEVGRIFVVKKGETAYYNHPQNRQNYEIVK